MQKLKYLSRVRIQGGISARSLSGDAAPAYAPSHVTVLTLEWLSSGGD